MILSHNVLENIKTSLTQAHFGLGKYHIFSKITNSKTTQHQVTPPLLEQWFIYYLIHLKFDSVS